MEMYTCMHVHLNSVLREASPEKISVRGFQSELPSALHACWPLRTASHGELVRMCMCTVYVSRPTVFEIVPSKRILGRARGRSRAISRLAMHGDSRVLHGRATRCNVLRTSQRAAALLKPSQYCDESSTTSAPQSLHSAPLYTSTSHSILSCGGHVALGFPSSLSSRSRFLHIARWRQVPVSESTPAVTHARASAPAVSASWRICPAYKLNEVLSLATAGAQRCPMG